MVPSAAATSPLLVMPNHLAIALTFWLAMKSAVRHWPGLGGLAQEADFGAIAVIMAAVMGGGGPLASRAGKVLMAGWARERDKRVRRLRKMVLSTILLEVWLDSD